MLAPAPAQDAATRTSFDRSLRPRHLAEFIGQERLKSQLEVVLTAAMTRGEALDHVLLVGPPGLGKTSLAYIIREELGVGIRTVAGPRSSARATSLRSSRRSSRATSSSSTRSTG